MSILDEIAANDAAIESAITAVLTEIKDSHERLMSLMQSLEASRAARQAQTDRVSPVTSALTAMNLP
jgi:hypothetical protein